MKKLVTAIALVTAASTAMAHPVNEPHTAENLLKHYNVEMPAPVIKEVVKEVVVEKEVVKEVEKKMDVQSDFMFIQGSVNYATDTEVPFAEVELGFKTGDLGFYGFVDIDENGDTFTKLNPTYNMTENTYLNYMFKTANFDDGYHSAGVGYRFVGANGFLATSINAVSYNNDDVMYDTNEIGVSLQSNFMYSLSQDGSWTANGWADINSYENHSEFLGNVGVTKMTDLGIYGRVGYKWYQSNADVTDNYSTAGVTDGLQFTVGYRL